MNDCVHSRPFGEVEIAVPRVADAGDLAAAGAEVRTIPELPMKLALFDTQRGMISLDDPVVSGAGVSIQGRYDPVRMWTDQYSNLLQILR